VVRVPGYRSRGPGFDSQHYFMHGCCAVSLQCSASPQIRTSNTVLGRSTWACQKKDLLSDWSHSLPWVPASGGTALQPIKSILRYSAEGNRSGEKWIFSTCAGVCERDSLLPASGWAQDCGVDRNVPSLIRSNWGGAHPNCWNKRLKTQINGNFNNISRKFI
jgi:hypothetical protein